MTKTIKGFFGELHKKSERACILEGKRVDGRAWDEIRWMKEQIFAGEAAFLESKGKPPFVPRAKAAKAK